MAEFEAKVYPLTIEEHPNADALEVARVGLYRSIVRKGAFKTGDLGVYIPEQAVLPEWLIKALGLEGRLAGKARNRVKAVKLRGVLSQGLIYPLEFLENVRATNTNIEEYANIWTMTRGDGTRLRVKEGQDVTEYLEIQKYEPEIPASMSGELTNGTGFTLKYDIENIKKYPNILETNEQVVVTEKLHGTWACFGWHPDLEETDGNIITSKGLSARGLVFKTTEKNRQANLYVKMFEKTRELNDEGLTLVDMIRPYINDKFSFTENRLPFYVLGEIYGKGVQDLHYGSQTPQFRVFDVYVGVPGYGRYLDFVELLDLCEAHNLPAVPILHVGEITNENIESLTTGKTLADDTTLNGHIREGIVIKPTFEREDDEIGRVILKSVSEDYLLRKGGTEFN